MKRESPMLGNDDSGATSYRILNKGRAILRFPRNGYKKEILTDLSRITHHSRHRPILSSPHARMRHTLKQIIQFHGKLVPPA
jgi:hypothetical protein